MDNNSFLPEGESQIYVGKLYLLLIARQMANIMEVQIEALRNKGDSIILWLNQIRAFYDLIENQLKLRKSEDEIDFFRYDIINNKLIKTEIKIPQKEKFERWFNEIESMYERNSRIQSNETNFMLKYNNDKKILLELSKCTRELYFEANKKHLIMPDVKVDMKELAKSGWVDREKKKELY